VFRISIFGFRNFLKRRSAANPAGESIDHLRICREDFGIERNQSFKGDYGNAQFSLCCTSTAMPDDDSLESTSGILFWSAGILHADATQLDSERALQFGLFLCTPRFVSKNFNAAFPMYSCSLARSTPGASMQASG
jgi:hypothetical protein